MRDIAKHLLSLSGKAREAMQKQEKVLAHLVKDKDLDTEKPKSNSSQWLKRASEEATDAIEHPEISEF